MARRSVCLYRRDYLDPINDSARHRERPMFRVLHDQSKFSDRFIPYTLERTFRTEERPIDQHLYSSKKRVPSTALRLARCDARGRTEKVLPKISQEMLAEMIGTTQSQVNSFTSRFRKAGVVQYDRLGQASIDLSLLKVVLSN